MQTASKTNSPSAAAKKPRGVRKDIGMLMFLLAAETAVVSAVTNSGAILPSAQSVAIKGNGHTNFADSDTSSHGETDSGDCRTPTSEEEEEMLQDLRGVDGRQATKMIVLDGAIMALVLAFIPWRRVGKMRGVNKAWLAATKPIVQIRHLPGTKVNAAFMPCPKNLDSDKETEGALQFIHPSTWRCVMCGFWNAETRVLCGNRQCQSPSLTHAGCARIFLGQLRRDATVPFIQWLIGRVIEAPEQLRNVENHRHNVTNRGKGCAWAYFKSEDVAKELLAYHRRMFLDSVDGVEGLWIVKNEDVEVLHEVASERGYTPQRPKCLPRNALVVEPPATGSSQMGRELMLSNYNVQCQYTDPAACQPTQTSNNNGEFAPKTPSTTPPAEGADIIPSPAHRGHARQNSLGAVSVTESVYSHDPYAYSPIAPHGHATYKWPGAYGCSANTTSYSDLNGDLSPCGPSPTTAAPPAYDDSMYQGSYTGDNANTTANDSPYYSSTPNYGGYSANYNGHYKGYNYY